MSDHLNQFGDAAGEKTDQYGCCEWQKPLSPEQLETKVTRELAKTHARQKRRERIDQNQGEKDNEEPAQHGVSERVGSVTLGNCGAKPHPS